MVSHTDGKLAIVIDDADVFGRMATAWAQELPSLRPNVLVVLALRGHRIPGLLDEQSLGFQPVEIAMPHLTDDDIEGLIEVLDRFNRLGILRAKNHDERVAAFRNQADRQLLVAMIQATSGKRLREKVFEEFADLPGDQQLLYATICLTNAQRYSLTRDEILIAIGRSDNPILNSLDTLAQRGIITRDAAHSDYRARHRLIAEEVVNGMEFRPYVGPVLEGLCFAFATRVRQDMDRRARPWRRLIRFINHEYIIRVTTPEIGRQIYSRLEDLLNWDYHFWLQRGSLEVEEGDLELAQNFLDQARSLAAGDRSVETEYSYFLLKRAAQNPDHAEAANWYSEGQDFLEQLIIQHGKQDSYPYHVLGSQGLAWAHRANLTSTQKRSLLGHLLSHLNEGVRNHPRENDLFVLRNDIRAEWLSTAVPPTPTP